MLDRIDMQVHLPRIDLKIIQAKAQGGDNSETVRERAHKTRHRQIQRQGKLNSQLSSGELDCYCELDDGNLNFLALACDSLNMSGRAYHRVLRLARTIADAAGCSGIAKEHLLEALSLRCFDRK